MNQIQYIKESCEHQNATTPEDFIRMTFALDYVLSCIENRRIDIEDIYILGNIINASGIRKTPVVFANGTSGISPQHIDRQLELLLDNQHTLSPLELYKRFEEIHPFTDGNGRTGSLLFNLLNSTMHSPIHPPDIFKD